MTVLFGTVEYFEKEISAYLNENQYQSLTEELLTTIAAKLEDEILNDFICDEKIRQECLENLKLAHNSILILK